MLKKISKHHTWMNELKENDKTESAFHSHTKFKYFEMVP
jgi:hypothetical protein